MKKKDNILFQKDSVFILLSVSLFYFICVFLIIPDATPFLKYPLLAKQFIEGGLDQNRIPDLSPIYFYLNVFIMYFINSITGVVKIIQILQIFLISFSSIFLFHTLRFFFPKILSYLGILLFVFSYSIIVYTKIIEPESLVIFFLSGFIYFINKKKLLSIDILIASIFFSFGVLTRSNFLPIVFVIPFFFWVRKDNKQKWIKNTIVFIIPVILSISFLIIRNYNIRGEFSPYAADPGFVFFEGNNPNSLGQSAIYPPLINEIANEFPQKPDFHHQVYGMFARKITKKNLSIVEVNDFWSKKAKNYIIDYPLVFLNLISKKIQYFFHNHRRHDLNNAYKYDVALKKYFFPIPFWIISVLALIGIIIIRKEWKNYFIFLSLFFIQFLALILIYVSERQRIAILPVFVFFALCAINYFYHNKKKILFLIPILLVAYFSLSFKTDIMIEEDYIWKATNVSYDLWFEAKKDRTLFNIKSAETRVYGAIVSTPWMSKKRRIAYVPYDNKKVVELIKKNTKANFSEQFSNAVFFIEYGYLNIAEKIMLDLYRKNYRFNRDLILSSQPLYYLGIIAKKRKNFNKAISYFQKALENNPGSPYALSQMFVLTRKIEYKKKIIRYFEEIDADFFIGKAFLEIGKPKFAKTYFENVLKHFPYYRRGLIYYAVSLNRLQEYKKAAFVYIKALKRRLDPAYFENDIVNIFKQWSQIEENNFIAKYYYGVVLGQFGYYDKAVAVLSKALALSDEKNNNLIKKELKKMQKYAKSYKIEK